MNILILTQHSFPYGMAQTNRLVSIAKGFVSAKSTVKVICTKATESTPKVRNINSKGMYEGVHFQYSSNNTIRSTNTISRIYQYYFGMINSLRLILKENREKKVDIIFSSYRGLFISFSIYILTRINNIKLIHERSEYPFLSYSNSIIGKLKLKIYLKLVCKLFDGFIVITNALKKYFEKNVSASKKIYILPILVEPERFSIQRNTSNEYIAYCGSMQGEKDGVSILIESFAKIADDFPKLELHLIGETKFNGIELLRNKINELKISHKVKFTGRVEREDLPVHLCNARILALARPANKQAEGGFPTKLGEYLATGRAVVVTSVGEIPEYLTHKDNAFLAMPNSADDFAEKLKIALSDENLCEKIGLKGKELAGSTFNYKEQGKKLVKWLNSEMLNIK